jgi:NAD(P)-dependent dehydrogenase (short-subunit alcohol dehydrogenase family)
MGQVMNVEGCTALITGADRGLGRALAGMLVQRGGAQGIRGCAGSDGYYRFAVDARPAGRHRKRPYQRGSDASD